MQSQEPYSQADNSADMTMSNDNAASFDKTNSLDQTGQEQEKEKKPTGTPIPMPAVGHTLEFPRRDTVYKKKESLPFDEFYSNVWKNRPRDDRKEKCLKWLVFAIAGVAIGVTAFLMD